jgi:hypothetical protein
MSVLGLRLDFIFFRVIPARVRDHASRTPTWLWLTMLFLTIGLPAARSAAAEPLGAVAQSVLQRYEAIQKALAADSLAGIAENAGAIATVVRADAAGTLPASIVADADGLAAAQDLRAARRTFKELSDELIAWLADRKAESTGYREAYCPMADANWLQKGDAINNPYLGKKMLHCGDFDRSF